MDSQLQAKSDLFVAWRPQPGPQSALLACPCFEIFMGGARGGGKSDGVLGEWAAHADAYGKHAIGLAVRRSRTELVETIERSKQIYTLLGANWHEQEKMWRFQNGARLRFAYLENDADAEAYQGHSYTRLYIEEAGNFPFPEPVFKLVATLRSAFGVPCKVILTGNPGGPGQAWIFARYVEPAPLGWQPIETRFLNPWTGEAVTRDRIFIPSRVTDNLYLGGDYIAGLQMVGSPALVRAWLEGDWSAIVGAYFPEFSLTKHVVMPFEVPAHWLKFGAYDHGSAAPFSYGVWTVADGTVGKFPAGAMIMLREDYGASAPNVGLKLPVAEIAERIKRLDAGYNIAFRRADPAIFREDSGPSIAEQFTRYGVQFEPADNTRVAGWSELRGRLIGQDAPMIYFVDICTATIRTIPQLQHDERKPEDVDTHSDDHAGDSARYACMARPWTIKAKPKPEPIKGWEESTIGEIIKMKFPRTTPKTRI